MTSVNVSLAPRFVDSHAHLDDPAFHTDLPAVLSAARQAGVTRVINIGFRPANWDSTMALARRFPHIAFTLGVHPQHAEEATPANLAALEELLVRGGACAIGEVGLDYFRDGPAATCQREAFAAQLALAAKLDLPVVIHQRAAEVDLIEVLRASPPTSRVVLHSFEGSDSLARFGLEQGYFFGVGGLITRRSAAAVRALVANLPLDRLVLETDAPYLVPTGVKNRRNSPEFIPRIAKFLAELKGISVNAVATATTQTTETVFRLPTLPVAANDLDQP